MTESIKNQDSENNITVKKHILQQGPFSVAALSFFPPPSVKMQPQLGIFTHGYTSHKASILSWPIRLAQEGIPSLIFDLPGHYLGSFNEVENLEDFKLHAPKLFLQGLATLQAHLNANLPFSVILGGHSLGALLAIKALGLPELSATTKIALAVGFGVSRARQGQHIFETPFFKSTLNVRGQLVSPALNPTQVFAWINQEKELIGTNLPPSRIHMIVGQEDLVVTKDGAEYLRELLLARGHNVSLERPPRLPHHFPEEAASYIKRFLVAEKILA